MANVRTVVLGVMLAMTACNDRRAKPAGSAPAAAAPAPTPAAKAAADPWASPADAPAEDYAAARRSFHTKLKRTGPSPQPFEAVTPGPDAKELAFESGGLKLRAWISAKPPAARSPAVLFLHGGFGFGSDDWAMAQPFRDAGFVVMMPILRGENGSPGAFSLFYDEVDDVLAAAAVLAEQPGVDPTRLYVSGHSAGGVLAMLAAMASTKFRAAAPMSGAPNAGVFLGDEELLPFDPGDQAEIRMRSPGVFAASFKCPARLFVGDQERLFLDSTRATAQRAKAAGRDVEAVIVPGNHGSMTKEAIPRALAFFQQQR